MTFRSHTRKEVMEALMNGKKAFRLDSANHGQDDVLIGSKEECIRDVVDNEGENVFWTQGWLLIEVYDITEA
jgi:hypothetical protein